MYICENCEAAFAEPKRIKNNSPEYGPDIINQCPYCGYEMYDMDPFEADECPQCHGLKFKDELLCRKCRITTLGGFQLEMRRFSRVQLEYLDALLDGETLENVLRGESKNEPEDPREVLSHE